MNILIVKLGSIGDIVHTLPSLALIRNALPASTISWAVDKKCAEILTGNSMIDHLIEVATKSRGYVQTSGETLLTLGRQISLLRSSSFDCVIDFQGLLKSAFIARLSGAEKRFGFTREALREPLSALLLTKTFKVPPGSHVIYKNLSLAAQALGLTELPTPDRLEFPIQLDDDHEEEAHHAIIQSGSPEFVILNPGGGWYTKLWSPDRYARLADTIWNTFHMRSIITCGPGELSLAEAIESSNTSGSVRRAELSLKGFCALAKKARLYIGSDTGPTHLAVAMGAPVIGLFGPTEWWRNGSIRKEDICVERNTIGCRENCHRRTCGKWICMDIEVNQVFEAVVRRLDQVARVAED